MRALVKLKAEIGLRVLLDRCYPYANYLQHFVGDERYYFPSAYYQFQDKVNDCVLLLEADKLRYK